MSRSKFVVFSLLAIAGLLLGACQPAAQPYTCTDEIGCIDIAPGAPIHIAYAMVVAGSDSSLGIDSRKRLRLPGGRPVAILEQGRTLTELFA